MARNENLDHPQGGRHAGAARHWPGNAIQVIAKRIQSSRASLNNPSRRSRVFRV